MSLHGAHKLVEHSVADCEQNKGRCAVVNDDAGHCSGPQISQRLFMRRLRKCRDATQAASLAHLWPARS